MPSWAMESPRLETELGQRPNLSLPQFLLLQTRDKNTCVIKLLGGLRVITETLRLLLPVQHFTFGEMISRLSPIYPLKQTSSLFLLSDMSSV